MYPAITDDPVGIKGDLLDFKQIAKVFANRIKRFKGSLTVGIHGKYGTGKTSFMQMIREYLEKDNENNHYFVDINA